MILALVSHGAPLIPHDWVRSAAVHVAELAGRRVYLGASRPANHVADDLTILCEVGAGVSGEISGEAIAQAYRSHGLRCLRHLTGRFCFILYDARAMRLVAAGSTAPPWPLAYCSDSRATIVASKIVPLLRSPLVRRTLDEAYLAHVAMGLGALPSGSSPFASIRRLGPGELLSVDGEGAQVVRVDRLVPRETSGRDRCGSGLIDELGAAVRHVTRRHRAVISVSGGLDSATLVQAALLRTEAVSGMSFVAPALDPVAEIKALDALESNVSGLSLTRIDVSGATTLAALDGQLRDDPLLVPLALLPARLRLWTKAKEAGADVIVEGEGADELFDALPTPLDALRHGRLCNVARRVASSPERGDMLAHGVLLPLLPPTLRVAWLERVGDPSPYLPPFTRRGVERTAVVREAVDRYRASRVHRPFRDRVEEWLFDPFAVGAYESRRHLAEQLGVDLVWPFVDRGVLEIVLGLHALGDIGLGPNKAFLRDALAARAAWAPRTVAKDTGLYQTFIPRILTCPRVRAALRDKRVGSRLEHMVDFDLVETMLDAAERGHQHPSSALWQLECLASFAEWYARGSRELGID